MQLLILIAGLVGVILNEQFTHQHTLGWALIGLAAFLVVLQLLLTAFFFKKANDFDRGVRSNFGRRF